jgi:Immunoglobulin-like domain of bacterial spore germination
MNALYKYLIFVVLLLTAVWFIFLRRPGPGATLNVPQEKALISSPVHLSGVASGWYFEGSFPMLLLDSENTVIAQFPAKAKSSWMTDEPVDFEGDMTFPPQPAGSRGYIVLKKDNPSGDPAHDAEVVVPIYFK